jgi:large subunit ribosomal protein L21
MVYYNAMYAIVDSGGKQYKVSPGDTLRIDRLSLEEGTEVTLDRVIMVSKEDGNIFGAPYISGAKVIASVESKVKTGKVLVFKQKTRKSTRKLRGHRQPYSALKIKEIILGG